MSLDDQATVRRAPVAAAITRLRAEVVAGPDAGLVAEGDGLSVGSAEDNDLVLTDRQVSRYHVELSRRPSGVLVRDLDSSNGTWVGDLRVHEAIAAAGTEIVLGQSRVQLTDGESVDAEAPEPVPGLVAQSAAMRDVIARVRKLADSRVPVLIYGETGTGKEVLAELLHSLGPRASAPFVVIDCASLPPQLIGSELFGHERGAFTGAHRRHVGAFERAGGGTVFLDEIGELPPGLQATLLGVLERRRVRRVGGERDIDVDVRVVAATHRDLRREVNAGSFRHDLYYRIAAARLHVPPLRERREDIEPLVRHFASQVTGRDEQPFDAAMLAALARHPWTGNARELRNVVEAALALGDVDLDASAPPAPPSHDVEGVDGREDGPVGPYKQARERALARFERDYFGRLLGECDGNASEAARRARMDRPYLLRLLKRNGLR